MSTTTLDTLEPGSKAIVRSVSAKGPTRRRIAEMGLCPGTEVTMVRHAPLKDPMEFLVRGYNLTLRKAEAAAIIVDREGGP